MVLMKCVYCGINDGITKDHIPPRSLFSKPKPNNLITVPCCNDCNKRFKKDEDLFMGWVLFSEAGTKKEGKKIWEQKLNRTFEKDYGLKKQIAKSFKIAEIFSPSGLYLGRRLISQIDPIRIENVIRKIVRGLFWFEYKEKISLKSKIEIIGIPKNSNNIDTLIRNSICGSRFWEKIFEYRYLRKSKDTFESIWIMSFYRELYYIALIDMSDVLNNITK